MGDFFGGLGGSLGVLGTFLGPGLGSGLSVAGGLIKTQLGDDPEALTFNPYSDDPFKPQGAMWGVKQAPHPWELFAFAVPPPSPVIKQGLDPKTIETQALKDEVVRRGAGERIVGRKFIYNAAPGQPTANNRIATATPQVRQMKPLISVRVFNEIVAAWFQRIDAQGLAPEFPYIDTRPWESYGVDVWHDVFGKAGMTEAQRKAKHYISVASSEFVANKKTQHYQRWHDEFHPAELDRYDAELDKWLDWKEKIELEEARRELEANTLAEFNRVWNAVQSGQLTVDQALALAPDALTQPARGSSDPGTDALLEQGNGVRYYPSGLLAGAPAGASSTRPNGALIAAAAAMLIVGVIAWR